MEIPAEFEWDDAKAEVNFGKHGLAFEDAVGVFADPDAVAIDTTRDEDGEDRRKLIGDIDGRLFTVVFTMRGDVCRIISARRANRNEERAYDGHGAV